MSNSILVFKSHAVNISNLVQYHVGNYYSDLFYKGCSYHAVGKFLFCKLGEVATLLTKLVDTDFRTAKWDNHISALRHYAKEAKNQKQIFMFGVNSDNQIKLLKQSFDTDITVVAINYDQHLYHYLLNNMAQYHVYLLNNNIIEPSIHDKDILKNSSPTQHYANAFADMKLLPSSSISTGDYNINIDDFFNVETMSKHFDNLGFPFIDGKSGIYHTWHQAVCSDMDVPCLTSSYCSRLSSGNTCKCELA